MKNNKRTLALLTAGLLAVTPMAATGMTAFAATITVNKVTGDTTAHSYKAYPIITGTLAEDGKTLTNMTWNAGINLPTLETALKAFDNTKFASFSGSNTVTTPEQFADMLGSLTDAQKEALAKVFNTTGVITGTGTALDESGSTYTATGLTDGWYIIKDETSSSSLSGTARSANILEIKGNTSIDPKYSRPTLEKKILEDRNNDNTPEKYDANTAAIGDTVSYEISTTVPDVRGYNKYFFIVEDNLSAGLTFNENTLAVKIGTTTLTKDTNGHTDSETGKYYVDTSGTPNIRIVFENFLGYIKNNNIAAGTAVTITYTATLNSNASIDPNVGNPNTAQLIYSNDPNVEYTGTPGTTPDEPKPPEGGNPGEVVGETPEDKVNTYTTAIKIKKVDQDNQPLAGATFTLQGTNLNKVKYVSGTTFEMDDTNGTYWKLKTDSYTTVDPATSGLSDEAKEKYSGDGHKYKKVEGSSTTATAAGDPKVITATVDAEGYLTFTGLNAGEYTLIESTPPNGYNAAGDISFTISASSINENSVSWSNSNTTDFGSLDTDNMFPTTITNRKGSILPTTGGMGTRIFYILGSLLIAGSLVFLVTKKRLDSKEN